MTTLDINNTNAVAQEISLYIYINKIFYIPDKPPTTNPSFRVVSAFLILPPTFPFGFCRYFFGTIGLFACTSCGAGTIGGCATGTTGATTVGGGGGGAISLSLQA
jgi:hypothetical protein